MARSRDSAALLADIRKSRAKFKVQDRCQSGMKLWTFLLLPSGAQKVTRRQVTPITPAYTRIESNRIHCESKRIEFCRGSVGRRRSVPARSGWKRNVNSRASPDWPRMRVRAAIVANVSPSHLTAGAARIRALRHGPAFTRIMIFNRAGMFRPTGDERTPG